MHLIMIGMTVIMGVLQPVNVPSAGEAVNGRGDVDLGGIPKSIAAPALRTAQDAELNIEGYLRGRIDRIIRRFFLETPESSPAILQVLRDRDRNPVRDPLVPWAGEFAGKFLTAAQPRGV